MSIDYALVSSVTALVAVIVGPFVTVWVAKAQIKASVVSANRQQWINRLRDEIAGFVHQVKHVPSALSAGAISVEQAIAMHGELALREEVVKLLLNPNEPRHQDLVKLMSKASNTARKSINRRVGNAKEIDEATDRVVAEAQKILKSEWERVKRGD
ncbi:MAG: hypothetical protein ACK5C3_13730 [bacterium]|jgi:hypothetical protein